MNPYIHRSHGKFLEKWIKKYKLGHIRQVAIRIPHHNLLEKWIKQYKLGDIRQVGKSLSKPLFLKNYKIYDRPTNRQTGPTYLVSSPETKNPDFAERKFSAVTNLNASGPDSKKNWTKIPY